MAKSTQRPKLTQKQHDFLELYNRLQEELGHAPSFLRLGLAHGGYAKGSEASGAQRMAKKLEELGVIEMPQMQPVGGGITALGRAILKRARGGKRE
jgi:SOS-response transcriptional repressor LexA